MSSATISCRIDERRRRLFDNPAWNGIDHVEVADDQLTLSVYFFDKAPKDLKTQNIRVDGGRRINGIKAVGIAPAPVGSDEADECLQIQLDRYGDFSTYTLRLVETVANPDGSTSEQPLSGFDVRYARIDFNFKIDCRAISIAQLHGLPDRDSACAGHQLSGQGLRASAS
jgi:hypothetical protein